MTAQNLSSGRAGEPEWPLEHRPTVTRAVTSATLVNDVPFCIVQMFDPMGDFRTVYVSEKLALDMAIQLLTFVRQVTT